LDLPVEVEGRVVCGITLIIQKKLGVALSRESCRPGIVSNEGCGPDTQRGPKLKQHRTYAVKPEAEAQTKEPIYAQLLRSAKIATDEAGSLADTLLLCLRRVCECTQWPFAHARILSQDDTVGARGAKEVWYVPFLDPQVFRDKALRMNRLRSGIDWRLRMLTTGRPIVLCDLEHDLDLKGQHAARELGLRSALGMPVLAGENIKAVCEFFSCESIKQDALWEEVFSAIGTSLSHAIELQRSRDRLREMTARFLTLQDDERRRLARELHDTTAQNVSMIIVNIELLYRDEFSSPAARAKLAECAELARQSLQEVRTFSYVLHPPLLEELGVFTALRLFIEGFSERSGIAVDLDLPDRAVRMPRDLETTIFRVIQESLSNVSKHSHSSRARVRVAVDSGGICINVEDDGSGLPPFDEDTLQPAKIGVGIGSMQERVKLCGGRLQLHSRGSGTQLQVSLPLPRAAQAATA
jgi:signal transduction histidine kinase